MGLWISSLEIAAPIGIVISGLSLGFFLGVDIGVIFIFAAHILTLVL